MDKERVFFSQQSKGGADGLYALVLRASHSLPSLSGVVKFDSCLV